MLTANIDKKDFTAWLREINIGDPVVWPTWSPAEGRLVVCLEPVEDSMELQVKLPESRDDMVKYMTTDVVCPLGMVLPTRRIAHVDFGLDHQVASVMTELPKPFLRRNRRADLLHDGL